MKVLETPPPSKHTNYLEVAYMSKTIYYVYAYLRSKNSRTAPAGFFPAGKSKMPK